MNDDYTRRNEPLYFGAITPYMVGLVVGSFFIGIGSKLPTPIDWMRDGFNYSGWVINCICLIVGLREMFAVGEKHLTNINIQRVTHGLQPLPNDLLEMLYYIKRRVDLMMEKHEQGNETTEAEPVAPPQPIDVWTEVSKTQAVRKHYDNPPSMKFIETVFNTANQKNRRILTELSLAKYGEETKWWTTTESNTWLTYLDEQGITVKAFESERGNAPRKLVDGMTLEIAASKFGLIVPIVAPALLDSSVAQVAPKAA